MEGSHVCAEKAKKKNDYRSESMTSDRHVMGVGVREDEVFGLVEAARKEDKKKKITIDDDKRWSKSFL